MRHNRREITKLLFTELEQWLDPALKARHFNRRSNSLRYVRKINGSTQVLNMVLDQKSIDRSTYIAAIYPRILIEIPDVDNILRKLTDNNNLLLEGTTKGKSDQPIAFTSFDKHSGRWLLKHTDDIPSMLHHIEHFLVQWTIPFLEEYSTPEDLIQKHTSNDRRVLRDRANFLRIIAAALASNQVETAKQILSENFSSPLLRERYHSVFSMVDSYGTR